MSSHIVTRYKKAGLHARHFSLETIVVENYEMTAKKELGRDYPDGGGDARKVPLAC